MNSLEAKIRFLEETNMEVWAQTLVKANNDIQRCNSKEAHTLKKHYPKDYKQKQAFKKARKRARI